MIDLNCDMGEGYENDTQIFPYITSCNISCGAHAGNSELMRKTVESAISHGLCIGAHPSYPDRKNFGRKSMQMNDGDLQESLMEQVNRLSEIVQENNGHLKYVKPHGALYHQLLHDNSKARVFLDTLKTINGSLAVMSMAGGVLQKLSGEYDIKFIAEAFADRRYHSSLELVNRKHTNALITNPEAAAKQAVDIATDAEVSDINGKKLNINARSICIHGDNPKVIPVLKAIHQAFNEHNIRLQSVMI